MVASNPAVQQGTVYRAPDRSQEIEKEKPKPKLTDTVLAVIDSVVEYPGSVKGDFGHWVFTEWLGAKIDQSLKRRGERE